MGDKRSVNGPDRADGVAAALRQRFGGDGDIRVAVGPGRVNLIGDHTDYNDGFVLPLPIGRGVWVAARRRPDAVIRVASLDFDEELSHRLGEPPPRTGWAAYVLGVADLLRDRGLIETGFDAAVLGDVPIGSGLSSSAALEIGTLLALQAAFGFALDPVAAARAGQEVEHRYVGVRCGIMDQFASRLGRAGHALFLDCRTLAFESVPVALDGMTLVVVDSKAPRSLAESAYNERRRECEEGVAWFRAFDPSIRALRDVTPALLEERGKGLSPTVLDRCRHVIGENARVQEAVLALKAGDAATLGRLMDASHASLRDLYAVSSVHLDGLVELAAAIDGVLGSRLTGAGFGGCTVHLVADEAVPEFRARVAEGYAARFGIDPVIDPIHDMLEAGVVR